MAETTVVLDAGHGGSDPGAVYNGRQEKDDTLRLTRAVGQILQDNGINVIYTRMSDIYETPFQKATDANNANGDYFVSIHRNSSERDNQYDGVETLVYNDDGIKAVMARNINAELEKVGFKNLGVDERPNLVVLKRTKMPAVLVEVGFINNDSDNAIFDSNFQKIAQGIADGILKSLPKTTSVSAATNNLYKTDNIEDTRQLDKDFNNKENPDYINSEFNYNNNNTPDSRNSDFNYNNNTTPDSRNSDFNYNNNNTPDSRNSGFDYNNNITPDSRNSDFNYNNNTTPDSRNSEFNYTNNITPDSGNPEFTYNNDVTPISGNPEFDNSDINRNYDNRRFNNSNNQDYINSSPVSPDYNYPDISDNTYNEPIEKLYRVQTGAFRSKENADRMLNSLLIEGFPAFIIYDNGIYKVQVGAFQNLFNAIKMEQRLRRFRYNTYISYD